MNICAQYHICAQFLTNALAIKSFKNYLQNIFPALAPKMLVKLTTGLENYIINYGRKKVL
jgi:hypothetical protein